MRNEVPYEPTFFKRKTAYANHNQVSIVGNGSGTNNAIADPPMSPNVGGLNKNAIGKDFARGQVDDHEENIMNMGTNYGGIPNNRRADTINAG